MRGKHGCELMKKCTNRCGLLVLTTLLVDLLDTGDTEQEEKEKEDDDIDTFIENDDEGWI